MVTNPLFPNSTFKWFQTYVLVKNPTTRIRNKNVFFLPCYFFHTDVFHRRSLLFLENDTGTIVGLVFFLIPFYDVPNSLLSFDRWAPVVIMAKLIIIKLAFIEQT